MPWTHGADRGAKPFRKELPGMGTQPEADMHSHRTGPLLESSFPNSGGGGEGPAEVKPKIHHTTATSITNLKKEWKRKPNVDGTGATHVKSFHCRLNAEAMEILDQQINQWLEEHPELEVKMVTNTVGEWQGKIKEPALIIQVWI